VCRSCTADLSASSYPDTVETFKREMAEAWLQKFPRTGDRES
jgi:hypothetical protein